MRKVKGKTRSKVKKEYRKEMEGVVRKAAQWKTTKKKKLGVRRKRRR